MNDAFLMKVDNLLITMDHFLKGIKALDNEFLFNSVYFGKQLGHWGSPGIDLFQDFGVWDTRTHTDRHTSNDSQRIPPLVSQGF